MSTHPIATLDRFEYGSGDLIIMCHGAASHSGQWRQLIQRLSPNYRIVAFDQYGYRNSPLWCKNRPLMIADQAAPILSYLADQTGPVHIVGHSHGSTIASYIAGQLSHKITSLSLYEPNAFGVLKFNGSTEHNKLDEIIKAFGDIEQRMDSLESRMIFAEELLNFWLGEGSWSQLPEKLQNQLVSMMKATSKDVHAALHSAIELESLKALGNRVLMMFDPYTPYLAQAVTQRYLHILTDCTVQEFPHCGHLAPIFYAERVNQCIAAHINRCASSK